MSIILNVLLLVIGFAALIKGADWFVDGSSGIARLFRVPSVIIGLTIVSLGTSAPELAVSISAALKGSNEIALSNAIGSNLFNLLVVLGVCALIKAIPVDKGVLKRDFPVSIAAPVIILIPVVIGAVIGKKIPASNMSENIGILGRGVSVFMLVLLVIYLAVLIYAAKKNQASKTEESENVSAPKSVILILVGLALIIIGGQLVVNNAKELAAAFGMSETLIGLTVVALGTSLPELVTSVVASRKGENGLAVGNVVGSNIFNIFLILGLSGAIHPLSVNLASLYDMIILTVVSIIVYIFARKKSSIGRAEGAIMIILYVGDIIFAILR